MEVGKMYDCSSGLAKIVARNSKFEMFRGILFWIVNNSLKTFAGANRCSSFDTGPSWFNDKCSRLKPFRTLCNRFNLVYWPNIVVRVSNNHVNPDPLNAAFCRCCKKAHAATGDGTLFLPFLCLMSFCKLCFVEWKPGVQQLLLQEPQRKSSAVTQHKFFIKKCTETKLWWTKLCGLLSIVCIRYFFVCFCWRSDV